MGQLGLLLTETGRAGEAPPWYQRAAEAGLAENGRRHEAEKWWRTAAAAGDVDSMYNLALLLERTGRAREAKKWWKRVSRAESRRPY